ncbi:class I SAM-dependent methyltransferase [Rhizorhabdus histidinilytica]|jgi:tRNA (cmo5U34)-methyltransferase|uniref:tRNA (Cmo5U34)-methyltransferase n=1 Tax=Rhizorhabdus histidinilytica TaxID=439228 RepID=A0A1T5FYD7_9SPHN|nr:class I SAM-dependent methyltransferase [Rhizorhabdus histidinilytica]QEH81426.1 class I SAM-dependent methyltransferase [Sphingomonas sp. C8-2]SKC01235.1 tRNA (cmo5U34)-methyltransferase [Rhizorhabdus histidinilytica]
MAEDGALDFMKGFRDAEKVAQYPDGPRRFVPGLEAVHRMTGLLLAERVPDDGRVLVLGAGGGLELKALAEAHPGWSFVGVDPAAEMLALAERRLGPLMERVELVEGYIDDAPAGPFDGATCLLTLHFLDAEERCRTAAAIRERLHPGAPFVAMHGSFPQGKGERALWLSRYAAFAVSSGVDPALAENARDSVDRAVNMFTPEQDETILRAAGFADLSLFYAAFTWRGWVGTA